MPYSLQEDKRSKFSEEKTISFCTLEKKFLNKATRKKSLKEVCEWKKRGLQNQLVKGRKTLQHLSIQHRLFTEASIFGP